MAVRLESAHLVADAKLRDGLLSLLKAGITSVRVDATPAPLQIRVAAQLAFTEPDMDRDYEYSLGIVDAAKSPLVTVKGEAFPTRPEGADRVFPYVFTIIEALEFVAPTAGYYAAVVALKGKPMKYLPFKVHT